MQWVIQYDLNGLATTTDCNTSVQILLNHYLFTYRNMTHYVGQKSKNTMLGRNPKTRLCFWNKSVARCVDNYHGSGELSFEIGETHYIMHNIVEM